MTLVVTHATLTGAEPDTTALVDGPKWDANHTLTGTIDATQLGSNVVQSVTNDTNVTGTIDAQNLTLGWTSYLSIARGGTGTSTLTSNAFPGPGDPTQGDGIASGNICAPLDMNVVYSGTGVYPFQVGATNPYCIGYAGNTISAVTAGLTYGVTVTSASITGSPVTVTVTAASTDVNAVVTALRAAINADSSLHSTTTGLPLFCQGGSGSGLATGAFNIQFDARYSDLTVAAAGTGTATMTMASVDRTLDYAVSILGRRIPSYTGQNGDNIHCLQFEGQSTSGAMDAVAAQICATLTSATAGNITSRLKFTSSVASVLTDVFHIADGMFLYRPLSPATNDGAALGTTALQWSDLFLASGGVINFNNGDVSISHAVATGGQLAFSGAASGYQFDSVLYPSGDGAAALGQLTLGWSNLFLSSAGTINFSNSNWVATHSSGILTVGTGDLRVTTAGTNTASVATVGGTQTLINKTLTNPNISITTAGSLIVADAGLSIKDDVDVTKIFQLSVGGITTGTTRTWIVPDSSDTFVGKATTDELTNKTLTSAVGKGTWTASGTWTLPAHTLGGAISGGGNNINNVNIGASSPGTGAFTTISASSTLGVTGAASFGPGGTGTTPYNADFNGGSGAAGGINMRWLKNSVLKWQMGFLNTLLVSGTSDDLAFYRATSSVFALKLSSTDDSVTLGAHLIAAAATTSIPSIRIPAGTAPSSPTDGDMWYDGTNVKFRVGAVTKTFTIT